MCHFGQLDDQTDLALTSQIFIDSKPEFYEFANETKNMSSAEVFAMYAPPDEKGKATPSRAVIRRKRPMQQQLREAIAGGIKEWFADATGLSAIAAGPRRYLWTDAFPVCNFIELDRRVPEAGHAIARARPNQSK